MDMETQTTTASPAHDAKCYYCSLRESAAPHAFRNVYVRSFRGGRAKVAVCWDKTECEGRNGKRVNVVG